MTASRNRIRVALHKPANAMAYALKAKFIVEKMANNAWFPQPFPPLAKVLAAAQELEDAVTKAQMRTKGLAGAQNEKRGALDNVLDQLKAYVEGIANENPEHAASIIESAGMDVIARSYPEGSTFRVTWGEVSGAVDIHIKAGPKGSTYYLQMSTNGGETWTDLGGLKQATRTVPGLVPGKTYWFRHSILTRKGQGDWSDKISIVVR